MEWGEPPTDRAEMGNVATPEPFSVPMPRLVVPSLKTTNPVATPTLPRTVAARVTPLPASAGFWDEVNVVVLGPIVGAGDNTMTLAEYGGKE